jgi:hypothetical protein
VNAKADVVALGRLIRYSQAEASRLGVSAVVVECLRMAGIELAATIGREGAEEGAADAERVRMN